MRTLGAFKRLKNINNIYIYIALIATFRFIYNKVYPLFLSLSILYKILFNIHHTIKNKKFIKIEKR